MTNEAIKTIPTNGSGQFNHADRIPNKQLSVKLIEVAKNFKGEYDRSKLLDIIKNVRFDQISVPVYSYKNLVLPNVTVKGHAVVGYISGYNPETEEFQLTIYGKHVAKVEAFKDPIIFPRISVREDGSMLVIALDVCPKGLHSKLFK